MSTGKAGLGCLDWICIMTTQRCIKCVIWDLDNTIWKGVLSEDDKIEMRGDVAHILETLDRRGILNSIASKNDYNSAMSQIEEFGLADYFLYPQIHWNSKTESIREISRLLDIGVDSLALIDDQPFEREEVNFTIPDVLCIDSADLHRLLEMPEMTPRFVTEDSTKRRRMYLNEIARNKVEAKFVGPKDEFLASLNMVFTISPAGEEDLRRAAELTERTHQLNTTGYSYTYEELDRFRTSRDHRLLIAGLDDKYGTYGKIGLALMECSEAVWTIKLLLLSCRVMARGVGSIMLNHLRREARASNVRLLAEIIPNDRNILMSITYKFAGFREIEKRDGLIVYEDLGPHVDTFPEYINVCIREEVTHDVRNSNSGS
ncbi:MAG: HAD-IIIC family phosphatase [Thermodesulfovibrionales bacterium]